MKELTLHIWSLPFLLVFLVSACQSPAVQGVVGVDRLAAVRQVKLGSGLVQVGQVESGHVWVGGVGAVQSDHCLIFLHSPAPPRGGRGQLAALAPGRLARGGGGAVLGVLPRHGLLTGAVHHRLGLSLMERPVGSKYWVVTRGLTTLVWEKVGCILHPVIWSLDQRVHLTTFFLFYNWSSWAFSILIYLVQPFINLLVESLPVTRLHHLEIQPSLLRRSNTNRLPRQSTKPGGGFSQAVSFYKWFVILILK